MSEANRGKVAESKLRTELARLEAGLVDFTFERILDAHSARGAMSAARAGDFVIYYKGKNILIEVKEVEHDFRLPKSNFKRDQRARMMKRQLAGSICQVVIYHSTTGQWRILPLNYFGVEEVGSWDLREIATVNIKQLIGVILCL